MIAERERRIKYKKQEEQRESVRQNLRDKVCIEQCCILCWKGSLSFIQYNIAKPEKESESEDEDDEDDTFGPRRKVEPNWSEDPVGGICS